MAENGKILGDAIELFEDFAVDFEVALPADDSDKNRLGSFMGDDPKPQPRTAVHEPILPADGHTARLAMEAGGNVTAYAYQWWSTTRYPDRTSVFYEGRELVVGDHDDYSAHAGFYIYYLNDRSDLNDL